MGEKSKIEKPEVEKEEKMEEKEKEVSQMPTREEAISALITDWGLGCGIMEIEGSSDYQEWLEGLQIIEDELRKRNELPPDHSLIEVFNNLTSQERRKYSEGDVFDRGEIVTKVVKNLPTGYFYLLLENIPGYNEMKALSQIMVHFKRREEKPDPEQIKKIIDVYVQNHRMELAEAIKKTFLEEDR